MEEIQNNAQEIIRREFSRQLFKEIGSSNFVEEDERGFVLKFRGMNKGSPKEFKIDGKISEKKDGIEMVLTSSNINQNNITIGTTTLTSFENLNSEITTFLATLFTDDATKPTLAQILSLSNFTTKILEYLNPKSVINLSMTSKHLKRQVVNSEEGYWKRQAKVLQGDSFNPSNVNSSYKAYYASLVEAERQNRRELEERQLQQRNRLLIQAQQPVIRPPRIDPHPFRQPDPDAEFFHDPFDPLNPLRNPRLPPGFQPPNPLGGGRLGGPPMRPPGNPDIDPFGDPMQREIFGPPRGGGFGGNPYFRGGGGGFI